MSLSRISGYAPTHLKEGLPRVFCEQIEGTPLPSSGSYGFTPVPHHPTDETIPDPLCPSRLDSIRTVGPASRSFGDFVTAAKLLVAGFHFREDFGVGGVGVDAALFLGILFEIEELPFVVAREMEEFVAVGADAVVGGDLVGAFATVEVVDDDGVFSEAGFIEIGDTVEGDVVGARPEAPCPVKSMRPKYGELQSRSRIWRRPSAWSVRRVAWSAAPRVEIFSA